jgi:hypothetical protein
MASVPPKFSSQTRQPPVPSFSENRGLHHRLLYFRPNEISRRLRDVLSLGRIRLATVADLFDVATSTDSIQQVVIDEANSTFCDGNPVDGAWIHTNPACEDRIAYKKIVSPSPYITVRVDPASSRLETRALTGLQPK